MQSAVGNLAHGSRQDFPIVISTMPATTRQRRIALGVIIFLSVVMAIAAPFANVELARVDAFIPVLQTVLCIADLITAFFLFAQYSIQPQRAILALGSGFIFSGLFAFLQTLAFPEAYARTGLIGDGTNSAAWLFVLWHTAFSLAAIVYTFWKDADEAVSPSGRSIKAIIGITIACVLTVIAGLTWIVTAGVGYLPRLYVDFTRQASVTVYINGLMGLLGLTALVLLFVRRRTILDLWLVVAIFATLPEHALATIFTTFRFTIGWYTVRCYALIASCTVLIVLLTETTVLYARLANAFVLLRRERANRLMSVEAATAAMAHEVRQPLAAIASYGAAGLNWLKRMPPNLEEVRTSLDSIIVSSHRTNEVISSISGLYRKKIKQRTTNQINDVICQVLNLVNHDLQVNEVTLVTEYQENLPQINADDTQLQQVVLNLIKNAVDAMSSVPPNARRLRLETRCDKRNSVVSLLIEDSGPGIIAEDRDRIFDPFFSTKPTGMGLGLSLCRAIVEDHGGHLRLTKTDSYGSIFEINLPISTGDSRT